MYIYVYIYLHIYKPILVLVVPSGGQSYSYKVTPLRN